MKPLTQSVFIRFSIVYLYLSETSDPPSSAPCPTSQSPPYALTFHLAQFGFYVSFLKPHSYVMFSLSAPTLCISLAKPQPWWSFTDPPPTPLPIPCLRPWAVGWGWGKTAMEPTLRKFQSPQPHPAVLPIASAKLVSFFFWKKLTETNKKVMSSALYFSK